MIMKQFSVRNLSNTVLQVDTGACYYRLLG